MITREYFYNVRITWLDGYSFITGIVEMKSWLPRSGEVYEFLTKDKELEFERDGHRGNFEVIAFNRI